MKYSMGAMLFAIGFGIGFISGISYEKKQIKKQLEHLGGSLIVDTKEEDPTRNLYLELNQGAADNLSKKSVVVLSVIRRQ